jgi:alpha-glucosidase
MEAMAGPWWQGGTIYQVYVRSFRDTYGDGYGDLLGVISKLDYLAWLGVDALWLSPTMPSPDHDWGYDVSDYFAVHPELGTMADLDRLIAEAGARGMRIVLDLVPNHTSSESAWFIDARSGRDSTHRDWYVWADPSRAGGLSNGGPPNNWRDATGESAWTLDERSGQYYLHNFLESQPDLNWWNPDVHREFQRIIRFWLDRGVAGFRIDVAHGLYKDASLRDDPPAPVGAYRPFGLQSVYSKHRPETHAVYREWRRLVDGYQPERLLLGETWVLDVASMAGYYGQGDELQLALNFSFFMSEFDGAALRSMVERTVAALPAGACPVWAASNHDESRFPTRWCAGDERRTRLALTVLCTLPGTTLLYYGDELGLGDVVVADADQRDPMSWHRGDARFNRDRARTPMPWDAGDGYGFTPAGVKPWLPFGDRKGVSVAEQRDDPSSVLSLTRALLELKHPDLSYQTLPAPAGVWMYRSGPLTVAANFTDAPQRVHLPAGVTLSSLSGVTAPAAVAAEGGERVIQPWEALVCHPG